MAISSLGVGSGLDIQSIVNKLMSVEQQPLVSLQTKSKKIQNFISEFGQIKSAYSQLQTAIQNLTSDASKTQLLGLQSSSSDTTVASASLSGSVGTGAYSLNVSSLASSQQLVSTGVVNPSASLTSSSAVLSFSFGTISGGTLDSVTGKYTGASYSSSSTKTINLTAGSSLNDVRDAINKAKLGVNASVVYDGAQYHLTLNSSKTGVANSMKLSVAGGDAALSNLLNQDPQGTQNFKQTNVAADFSGTLNGISITSTSNTLTNTIPGMTINALKVGTATINVSQSSSSPANLLNPLINAWNSLNSTVRQLTSYDPATKKAGDLLGDSLVSNSLITIRNQLFSTAADSSSSANKNYNSLIQIGVSVDSKGVASLDSTKLLKALNEDPNALVNLFSTSGGAAHVTKKAESSLTQLLGTGTGFQSRLDNLNNQLKANQKQQDNLNTRLTQIQKNLVKQYTNLDSSLAQMQQTSSRLTSIFSALSSG